MITEAFKNGAEKRDCHFHQRLTFSGVLDCMYWPLKTNKCGLVKTNRKRSCGRKSVCFVVLIGKTTNRTSKTAEAYNSAAVDWNAVEMNLNIQDGGSREFLTADEAHKHAECK